MPGMYADWVKETTATVGTGTFSLAGAVAGYQAFSAAFVTGTIVSYAASDGTNWEVGLGVYTTGGATLSRFKVLESSNANALVNFPGPSTTVACVEPAETIADIGLTSVFATGILQ